MDKSKISQLFETARDSSDDEVAIDAFNQLLSNNKIESDDARILIREARSEKIQNLAARFLKRPTVKSENRFANLIVILVFGLLCIGGYFVYQKYFDKNDKQLNTSEGFERRLMEARERSITKNRSHYGVIEFENNYKFDKRYGEKLFVTADFFMEETIDKRTLASIDITLRFLESKKTIEFKKAKVTKYGNLVEFKGKWVDNKNITQPFEATTDGVRIVIKLFRKNQNSKTPILAGKLRLYFNEVL